MIKVSLIAWTQYLDSSVAACRDCLRNRLELGVECEGSERNYFVSNVGSRPSREALTIKVIELGDTDGQMQT